MPTQFSGSTPDDAIHNNLDDVSAPISHYDYPQIFDNNKNRQKYSGKSNSEKFGVEALHQDKPEKLVREIELWYNPSSQKWIAKRHNTKWEDID